MISFFQRVLYAMQGWVRFFSKETNGQIQLVIAALVISAGFYFRVNAREWLVIMLCIAIVIGLEMLNSALETLADKLHPGRDKHIRDAKDMAAGAVLLACVISVICGLIIFIPYLASLAVQ